MLGGWGGDLLNQRPRLRGNTKWVVKLTTLRCYKPLHVLLIKQIPQCFTGILAHQWGQDLYYLSFILLLKDVIIFNQLVILFLNVLLAWGIFFFNSFNSEDYK